MAIGTITIALIMVVCIIFILLGGFMDDIVAYLYSVLLKCHNPYIYYKQIIAYDEPGESNVHIRFFRVPRHLKLEFELEFTWSNEFGLSHVYELVLGNPDVKEQTFRIITKEDLM